MTGMLFGLGFLGDGDARETLEWGRELDREEELDRIWIADEHFLRDPWVQLGALAGATSRLAIGVCVTDPYHRHPALTATAAATLQELSGGRALLGVGAGSTGFDVLGVEQKQPAQAVSELIDLCRRMWTEKQPFSYAGRLVHFSEGVLDFEPPGRIPIYVAARGPRMLATAARKADAVLIGSFVQGPGLDYALRTIEAALDGREPGLGPLRRAVWAYFSVARDGMAARRAATRGIALALRSSLSLLMDVGYEIPADLVEFIERSRHTLEPEEVDWVAGRLPASMIDDLTLAGDAGQVVEKLHALAARGVEEVALLPFAPPGSTVRDVAAALLREVAPAAR
jgi:5,10-methylenetetrahydromethanopterin reductase